MLNTNNTFDAQTINSSVQSKIIHYQDFLSIKPWKSQRDDELRAKKVAKKIRGVRTPTINEVAIALWNNEEWIVNGNTRKRIWSSPTEFHVSCPNTIRATYYHCASEKEVDDLYFSFDSSAAVENRQHKIQGCYRKLALNFNDPKIRKGELSTVFGIVSKYYVTEFDEPVESDLEIISEFKYELLALDKIGLSKSMNACITASCLMMLKKYGPKNERVQKAIKFIKEGISENPNHTDGVSYIWSRGLSELPEEWGSTKWADIIPQMNYIIYCFESFLLKKNVQKVHEKSVDNYINFWNS
jgi:hypothetical protein